MDSSAVMAVLLQESQAAKVNEVVFGLNEVCMGAPTRLELAIVATNRLGLDGLRDLDRWMDEARMDVVEFTQHHQEIAFEAFYRFGKGRHRAGLNFGDCMSYAVAAHLGAPLLFVGEDFVHTDLRSALPSTGSGS